MKKIFFTLLYVFIAFSLFSQGLPIRDFRVVRDVEKTANSKNDATHSSIKPFRNNSNTERSDSILDNTDFLTYSHNSPKTYFRVMPLYGFKFAYDFSGRSDYKISESAGALFNFALTDKLSIDYALTQSYLYQNHISFYISGQSYNFDDLWGMYSCRKKRFMFDHEFSVNYSPADYISLEIGNGSHFFGDGYRSLLLSSESNKYPYFKVETEFLNFKYACLWSIQNTDYSMFPSDANMPNNVIKYNVSHYLDWRIGKHINLAFFETIISSPDKFLAAEYFNPVIFFRPVEFSIGSSDNAMMGANLKISFSQKNYVYGQVLIDDVIVGQLKNDIKHFLSDSYSGEYGWFANKWGLQGGIKFFDIFKLKNTDFFTEINIVRPYVYSHGISKLTYTHDGKPLAHPLGANFMESASGIFYYNNTFECSLKFILAVVGTDTSYNSHNGQNIFYSTMDAPGSEWRVPVSSYSNVLLQGTRANIATINLDVSYYPFKDKNFAINAGFLVRNLHSDYNFSNTFYSGFYIGLKSRLWREKEML